MAMEHGQPQDVDLDRTDRLPILQGVDLGGDYGDDAVRMDAPNSPVPVDFVRPPPIDLPSLAESVRSVEERIARQNAEYEVLNRSFQRSRDAETAANGRVTALEQEVSGLRVALEGEKDRRREQERLLNDKSAAVEAARARAEETLREAERHRAEAAVLRDSLSARETNIAQVTHSLGERDAQLSALQAEHGRVLPALQAREKSAAQLESDLAGTRSQLTAVTADLRSTQETAASLGAQLQRHEAEVRTISSELAQARSQSNNYMELLSSRAWRAGFDQNLFLDMDARATDADRGRDDRAKLMEKIAEQAAAIEKLQAAAAAQGASLSERTKELKQRENTHSQVSAKVAGLEAQLAKQTSIIEKLRSEASAQGATLAERTKDLKARDRAYTDASSKLASQELLIAKQNSAIEQLRDETGTQSAALAEHSKDLKQRETAHTELSAKLFAVEAQLAKQSTVIEQLRSEASTQSAALAERSKDLTQRERMHTEVSARLSGVEAERTRLSEQLAAREKALAETQASSSRDVQRVTELLAEAERGKAELAAQIAKLNSEQAAELTKLHARQSAELGKAQAQQSAELSQVHADYSAKIATLEADAKTQEDEMAVLVAHLREAQRPIEVIEANVTRLNELLAAKTAQIDALAEENKKLTATVERTRGALEEREFLIRRLERSETNNANALGRIQTSMERLGAAAASPPPSAPAQLGPEWQPQFIRVDGERNVMHTLARRTRIGRASTCELQIDSSSVSRHHALVVVGPREAIIEDLNSTNGVIVNSRKVTRHVLNEGDVITLGDIVFKFATQHGDRPVNVPAALDAPLAE